ncbi:MAG: NAD(P)/FAD-dependent oxidoreductase [Candidatus Omnitrophota bacterium]
MYDLAVIGSGAAGIAVAKYALQRGLKTVICEKNSELFGGTCLNRGCIPTKFFLHASKLHKSWEEISLQKTAIINSIKNPTLEFFKKNGIDIIWSEVSLIDEHTIATISGQVQATYIVIATGSTPKRLPQQGCICAEELFEQKEIGSTFLVVGAGYIGVEFASLLGSFSKQVTVIEKEERILPTFEYNLANRLKTILARKGIVIQTGVDIKNYDFGAYDMVLVSIGRQANTSALGLEKVGIIDKNGWIVTDECLRTNKENIYACGDVNGKRLLAYAAEYQARVCVDNIVGTKHKENYDSMPECVFSLPQLARVGMSEEEAQSKNIKYKIVKSNFLKFSSSYVYGDSDGFMQVIADERDMILGAGIISNSAAELISIFSLAMQQKISLKKIQECFFVHPTLSEIIPSLLRDAL